jgi:hypothetical protein
MVPSHEERRDRIETTVPTVMTVFTHFLRDHEGSDPLPHTERTRRQGSWPRSRMPTRCADGLLPRERSSFRFEASECDVAATVRSGQ